MLNNRDIYRKIAIIYCFENELIFLLRFEFSQRLEIIILNGCGALTIPRVPVKDGGLLSSSILNRNRCTNDVMNKNSSILARDSPRHTLLPVIKNEKSSCKVVNKN